LKIIWNNNKRKRHEIIGREKIMQERMKDENEVQTSSCIGVMGWKNMQL
jgi:hypothetical protein